MITEDLTIYYPLRCNGIYEPTAYSFYGSVKAFSEPKDAFEFIKKSYLTEEECQRECDKLNGNTMEEEIEQPEYSYLEKFQPVYHRGKNPTWEVGDTLAYYELTSDAEGECIYGTVAEVHFDEEHKDWRYQLKDYPHWMDDGVIYESELIWSEAYKTEG